LEKVKKRTTLEEGKRRRLLERMKGWNWRRGERRELEEMVKGEGYWIGLNER